MAEFGIVQGSSVGFALRQNVYQPAWANESSSLMADAGSYQLNSAASCLSDAFQYLKVSVLWTPSTACNSNG